MERKMLKSIIIVFLFAACNWDSNHKIKGFYDYSRVSDLYRIPLIEPYEIISSDRGFSWLMNFKGSNPPSRLGSGKIDSIGMKQEYFILYNKRAALPIGMTEAWFLINPGNKEERVFTSDQNYKEYLKSKRIGYIKLYDINKLFKDFDEKGELPPEWPKQPEIKK